MNSKSERVEKAAPGTHHVYARPAGCVGGIVCQDTLPGHIHAGRGGAQDTARRVASSSEFTNLLVYEYFPRI